MCNNFKQVNCRKRPFSVLGIEDSSEKKQLCILNNEVFKLSQNTNFAKKLIQDKNKLYDYLNYSSSKTVESETVNRNYIYSLTEEDIRRIVSVECNNLYDIHKLSNNYENIPKGFSVISDNSLDCKIIQVKETFNCSHVALRTFIINLRKTHWVVLVVSHQNGVCVGYVDSLYDEDGEDNERNKIPDNIKEILINRVIKVEDLKIYKQNNNYNCGLLALENANGMLRVLSADVHEIFRSFHILKSIASSECLTKKLKIKDNNEDHHTEFLVKTSNENELIPGNLSSFNKEEMFSKPYIDLDDSNPCRNKYDRYAFGKMRGYFNLLGITYQLHLMMLCFYRAFIVQKIKTFSMAVEKVGVGRFDDIVLYHRNEAICIQIKHIDVERYYNSIGYLELFPTGRRKQQGMFSIRKYFSSFTEMKYISDVKYISIYTNADLNLTEGMRIKRPKWSRNFFPIKFDIIDIDNEEYKILKDCLCTRGTSEGHGFYRFSFEEATRAKLLNLLGGNNSSSCDARNLEEMKNIFLNKLIFVVNQPGREELNYIIKREIDQRCKTNIVPHVFNELQEGMLSYLTYPKGIYVTKENAGIFLKLAEDTDSIDTVEQDNKYRGDYKKAAGLRNCTPHLIYKLELFMYCLYRMYQRSDGISISAENENTDITSNICFHYENKITYVWTKYGSGGCINFSMLFPGKDEEGGEMFSLNRYFKEYIKHIANEIWSVEHLVIYTNMGLDITEEGMFIDVPIKFNSMDIRNHKVLMGYLRTSTNSDKPGFYQFSIEKETISVLFSLLDPEDLNYQRDEVERLKINFLETLVFAVKQLDREKLVSVNKKEIQEYSKNDQTGMLLEYIALHEVALRCLSASNIYCITRKTVVQKFRDVKDNKLSARCTGICNEKKDEFARTIVADRGLCHFREFRKFLDSKEGSNMFDVLCKNKAKHNVSCILTPTGIGIISAFKKLYYMLFDKDGDKSDLLQSLIESGLKLRNISSILKRAGNKAPEALKGLCTILRKKLRNGETYLEFFKRKKIIDNICSMLNGAGNEAANAIFELHNVLITRLDNDETLLEFILRKNIVKNISSMLNGAGNEAANALKQLYNMFIMKIGKKETVLEFICRKNIMKNISSMLSGAGQSAPQALATLCTVLCKKVDGEKTYLELFIKMKIMGNISSMLSGAGCGVSQALEALISVLRTRSDGGSTYLDFFVGKKIMANISSILNSAGKRAPEALARLCTILNRKMDGEKTYLEFFLEPKIMANISSMLSGAGESAPETLEALCAKLITKFNGEITYLDFFVKNKIMRNISSMLNGAGKDVPEALEALCAKLVTKFNGETTYLDFFVNKKIMGNISSMLSGTGKGAPEALESLFSILSTKFDGEMSYLDFFVNKKIIGNISSMLHGAGQGAPETLEALCAILITKFDGEITYLDFFVNKKIMGNISSMLHGAGQGAPEALEALCEKLITKFHGEITYLDFFVNKKLMGNISSMLNGAGKSAPEALESLCSVLETKYDDEMTYLDFFVNKKIMGNISSMLSGAGKGAPEALESLCLILRSKCDGEITYLDFFVNKKVMGNISSMLNGAGKGAPEALVSLCSVLDTKYDGEMTYLNFFVNKKIMGNISSMLSGAGKGAPEALESLCLILGTKCDGEMTYLDFFVNKKVMGNISSMLNGAGKSSPEILEALCAKLITKFNGETTYLDFFLNKQIMGNISSMLHGAGQGAPEALEALCAKLMTKFDGEITYLDFFVNKKIMGNVSSILRGAGQGACEALESLYSKLSSKFDGEITYLEFFTEKKILGNISCMLNGAGRDAVKTFEVLFALLCSKFDGEITYLEFFIENKIMGNISSMLSGAGKGAPEALESLCSILVTKCDGEMTYLDIFVNKKIMGNISCMLNGAGRGAPKAFEALCTILCTKLNDEMTYLDFFIEKKIMQDIARMLHGGGRVVPEALKELISFLFTKLTDESTYLDFFLENNIFKNIPHVLKSSGGRVSVSLKGLQNNVSSKQYLSLEGLNLSNLSRVLSRRRSRGAYIL